MHRLAAFGLSLTAAAILAGMAVAAQSPPRSTTAPATSTPPPRDAKLCDILRNHERYDNVRVRTSGFVNYAFEDFTLWDPTCISQKTARIWVTFGGAVSSGVIYAGGREGLPRPEPLPWPLVEDATFKAFQKLIGDERDTVVRVNLVGTLLNKKKQRTPDGREEEAGYGHFWCCDLFVVERVEKFEPHTRHDLEYSADHVRSDEGAGTPHSCLPKSEQPQLKDERGQPLFDASSDGGAFFINLQKRADRGDQSWAFTDPARVALTQVRRVYGGSVEAKALRPILELPARQAFEWLHNDKWTTVVVARPYWLSFFAKTERVAWVPTWMSTGQCTSTW